ncbi:Uncharacterised protein [Mycobacterium tuberculosis]|uniref:Uncharacterized protein n=1 Tax=Mycobacterium tuberculosis TaxID=1773 RepID=A0A916LAS4_MYCTX|nr:Uncharacterised protein [Mycobacterium tuberculosis]COY71868.1 Uncharacterised protein [Mycobacterium tuberculosis]
MRAQRLLFTGHQGVEQVVLGVEVPVDQPVRQAGLLGDVCDGGGMKTLVSKHYFGRGQDLVAPLRLVLIADRSAPPRASAAHLCTNPCSCPTVSMNSSTMSSTTERADRTRSSEPTTCPTK